MDKSIYKFFCWISQILIWVFFIVLLLANSKNKVINEKDNEFIYVFVGFYIIYLFLEFRSHSLLYIKNKGTSNLINQDMGRYFRTYPEINFYCECYHYEQVHCGGRGQKKVITHKENYTLPYYSERDISGLFILDVDSAKANSKQYIQLDLFAEINFADAISYMDYEYQKDLFWRRNRFRDKRFYFKESRIIPGMISNNLIKLTNNEPCCINTKIYVFFTILALCEFYKLYFDCFCIYQSYRIRKIVSTRYDLNQPIYQSFVPQLNLLTQKYNYQPEDYNFINNNYKVEVPTARELNIAKKYQDKIPDYNISSGNDKFHAGVVIDNSDCSNFNPHEPPPAFAEMGNDVEINDNQINPNGGLPPDFTAYGVPFNDNVNNNNQYNDYNDQEPDESYNRVPIKKKQSNNKIIPNNRRKSTHKRKISTAIKEIISKGKINKTNNKKNKIKK